MLCYVMYCLERLVFQRERHQILFVGVFCIKRKVKKISNFWPKPWTLEKCQFCVFLKPMFSLFRKACLLCKTSKIVFHYFFSRSMTWEYRGLEWVTGGYKGWQGVTRGDRRLQGVIWGDRGLQGVTGGYKGSEKLFLTRTFPDTFSWSILNKKSNLKKYQIFNQNDGLTPLKKF